MTDGPPRPLTAEQRALVLSVPGLAERAAWEFCRRHGQLLPTADLVSLGHLAIVLAAQRYDPAYGVPFGTWAFYRAVDGMLDGPRRESRARTIAAAARGAACRFAAQERPLEESATFADSDDDLRGRLAAFTDGAVAAMFAGAAAAAERATTEEDLIERDAWTNVLGRLRGVLDELQPDQRELIDRCYLDGASLKTAAERQGINYFRLLDKHQALMKLLGARLRGQGIHAPLRAPPGEGAPAVLGRVTTKEPAP